MLVESRKPQSALLLSFKQHVAQQFDVDIAAVTATASTLGVTTLAFHITFEFYHQAEGALEAINRVTAYEHLLVDGEIVPFIWRHTAAVTPLTECILSSWSAWTVCGPGEMMRILYHCVWTW
jgi:hypothetical protein